ncbi:MAG: hypothetical protein GYB31_00340 [Bacteroidetes bacterium]|nr:hypothetical protein [Bacteroidota bacterium]
MKKLLIPVFLFLFFASANGQINIGLQAGYNNSWQSAYVDNSGETDITASAYQFSFILEKDFGNRNVILGY